MSATTPFERSIILLVEDEDSDALLLEIAFKRAALKWPLFRVANGLAAQAYLNGSPPYQDRMRYPFPALVLLDVRMPLMDGFEVLRWMRQQPAFASLPVVMLTGCHQIKDADIAHQLGVNSFFEKPMDFKNKPELWNSIERLMQKSK